MSSGGACRGKWGEMNATYSKKGSPVCSFACPWRYLMAWSAMAVVL
jgi:hypothetical protein